jgi:hypothetical protein
VAVTAAITTAALAVAASQGWATGKQPEFLLAAGMVTVAVCAGWLVLQLLIVVLQWAGASFLTPARPFGLERILALMELQALERETAATQRPEPKL